MGGSSEAPGQHSGTEGRATGKGLTFQGDAAAAVHLGQECFQPSHGSAWPSAVAAVPSWGSGDMGTGPPCFWGKGGDVAGGQGDVASPVAAWTDSSGWSAASSGSPGTGNIMSQPAAWTDSSAWSAASSGWDPGGCGKGLPGNGCTQDSWGPGPHHEAQWMSNCGWGPHGRTGCGAGAWQGL